MAAFYNDTIFVRCDESGTQSSVKLISRNFLQTIDDVFFRLPFASVEDMNKALVDAKVTEKDMASFTGRLNADHDNKNARAHLQSGLETLVLGMHF